MTQPVVGVLGHEGLVGGVLDLAQSAEGIVDVLVVLGVVGEVAHRVVDERVVVRAVVVCIPAGQLVGVIVRAVVVILLGVNKIVVAVEVQSNLVPVTDLVQGKVR